MFVHQDWCSGIKVTDHFGDASGSMTESEAIRVHPIDIMI